MKKITFLFFILFSVLLIAQNNSDLEKKVNNLQKHNENLRHRIDVLQKKIDDVIWFERMKDVAFIDKIYITGPPNPNGITNKTAMGVNNPIKFWSYVFIPKNIDYNKKYPLMVFPHGGVHGDFSTYYTHIVKELMYQGYIVIAPEYRGSTGYGKGHYKKIDYGGLENEDVYNARNHMIENYHFIERLVC